MWGLLAGWALLAIAFLVSMHVVPGVRVKDDLPLSLLVAVVFGLVNVVLGPVLRLATLPLRILTLGLLAFVLNAALLLAADRLVPSLSLEGFWTAIVAAFVLSVLSALLNALVGPVLRAATG